MKKRLVLLGIALCLTLVIIAIVIQRCPCVTEFARLFGRVCTALAI